MPSNFTDNYQLSQWERTDKIQMEDFNDDNAKIDGALAGLARTAAAHGAELARKGNCQVSLYTYKGTGTCGQQNPTVLTFPKGTFLLCVIPSYLTLYPLLPGAVSLDWHESGVGHFPARLSWTETSVSIYSERRPSYQFNDTIEYTVLSLRMADQP